jgi:putative flavoprotein involved in K+ transport
MNCELAGWCAAFAAALDSRQIGAAADLFLEHGFWRDLVAFTWNIETLEGRSAISAMLAATLQAVQVTDLQVVGATGEANGVTEGWLL